MSNEVSARDMSLVQSVDRAITILEVLAAEARRLGFAVARLDAQAHAADFYRKFGFADGGERHWDAGILHQPMSRVL